MKKTVKNITLDDVERLSKGLSTKSKQGSRKIPHRLTIKERTLFESAKKNGFLKIPYVGVRENLINIYKKWCEVKGREAEIRYEKELNIK